VLLLVVVLVAADLAVTAWVERRAEEQVAESLGAPATVALSGWPVAARKALSHIHISQPTTLVMMWDSL
jgi:hypothetical protein